MPLVSAKKQQRSFKEWQQTETEDVDKRMLIMMAGDYVRWFGQIRAIR